MDTQVDEISDGIYRISTFIEPAGLRFNQYLVDADEPLLFHTGQRGLFPLVTEAVARVRPVESLRWISWGHLESDESGAMNEWLGVAPDAAVAVGFLAGIVSVNDLADRPPRLLGDDDRGSCRARTQDPGVDARSRMDRRRTFRPHRSRRRVCRTAGSGGQPRDVTRVSRPRNLPYSPAARSTPLR